MERADSTPEESSETGEIKEEISLGLLNTEIDKIIEEFLKSEQDLEISEIFSKWILEFIKRDIFNDPKSNFKLYDIFEQFNQSLVKPRSTIIVPSDTPPTKPSHFEVEANLIEEMIRRAIKDSKIFHFIHSSKWNELRVEFCKKEEKNYCCIESLEKLIMFQNLMQLKIEKYKLKQGW